MPTYNDLRPEGDLLKRDYELIFPDMTKTEKKRTLKNLLALREGLSEEIPPKKADENLLIASWNIKEFGHTTQRLPEAYFYTAEIISRFDLVVVQEVKTGLEDLYILMRILGDDWAYLINDITEGTAGNSERSAYIYNKKRVEFSGLAGEIVLWDTLTENSNLKQLKRTPYITGFRAGWKTFAMICLHLHPGKSDSAGDNDFEFRAKEVDLLLQAIEHKISEGHLWNENIILCGDFNFYRATQNHERDDPTVQKIFDAGYKEVESLQGEDTNVSGNEAYDRMFLTSNDYFKVALKPDGEEKGGVFRLFEYVYKVGQESTYAKFMKEDYTGSSDLNDPEKLTKYFKHPWRKNQMSDHYPIWFELVTDSADEFLESKLAEF